MHTVSAAHISSSEHQSVADAHKKLEEIALAAKGPGWRSALPSVRKDTEPCLQALQSAKARNWLGYDDDAAPPLFDIEMASHYARAANGNIRVIIPGKLILVPTPRALPKGRFWVDVDEPGRPLVRHFSAVFLAELLVDHEAAAVVSLGRSGSCDDAAFLACGLDVHDLSLDTRRPALLGPLDRLAAIARAAPGPVAVYAGGDEDEGEDGSLVACMGTLAESLLMMECGFGDAAAAALWVRLAGRG